jgi:hypothetical protein
MLLESWRLRISRRVTADISIKEIEVEKEDFNKVGDGLTPVYH